MYIFIQEQSDLVMFLLCVMEFLAISACPLRGWAQYKFALSTVLVLLLS